MKKRMIEDPHLTFKRNGSRRFLLGFSTMPVYEWDDISGRYLELGFGAWSLKLWLPARRG
jgi:hypothetical protein